MKDIPIGSKTVFEGDTLVVEESPLNVPSCRDCYFSNYQRYKQGKREFSCYIHGLACTPYKRKDNKHVIFKKLN